MAKEIKFEIIEEIEVLSESFGDWSKELNLVSWNGGEPKLDIRPWDTEHEKMKKGITLSYEEGIALRDALNDFDFDSM